MDGVENEETTIGNSAIEVIDPKMRNNAKLDRLHEFDYEKLDGDSYAKLMDYLFGEVVNPYDPPRLNSTADWCENTENKIVEFMGEYYFPDEWGGSETAYSRDYIFQTPDTILKTYYDMKANGMTDSMLDDQYKKYIKALYQANPFLQDIYLKKFAVEPFPHLLASDVEKSTCVTEVDKLKKRYFGEWEETITDAMWLTKDRAVLDKMLYLIS